MTSNRWTGVLRKIRGTDDEGAALVVVVGSMLVLAMLAMTALAYTLNSQKFARYDQNYSAAMAAAQAGVDDFISRMDRDVLYGDALDCANDAWRGPTSGANPCGWTTTTAAGWLPVEPGATAANDAHFHYSVDATDKRSKGSVLLTATGRVGDVYRTIQTTVGKGGSTDYVYYTDFESADPSNVQAYSPSGTTKTQCGAGGYSNAKYFWQGRSGCQEITFINSDELDGAVFTNDSILSSGATFKAGVETANPNCRNAGAGASSWNDNCLRPGSTANFNLIKPQYAAPKYLDDNSAAFATNPGCHYYGATRVIFTADGKMTVWNKKSVNGNRAPVAIQPPGGTAPLCGTVDELDQENGVTLNVPNEMVIYAAGSGTANRQCYAEEIGGRSGARLPLGSYKDTTPASPTGSGQLYTFDVNMQETTKYCGQGNLYAEGILKGRVTLSAEQSIVVTGDLLTASNLAVGSTDMLGLVATNSVEVFRPRLATVSSDRECLKTSGSGSNKYCSSYGPWRWLSPTGDDAVSGWPVRYKAPTAASITPSSGIQIQGSIQTLQHSFLVQKYGSSGNSGTLQVRGSIAQRWRGAVGTGSGPGMTGYSKLYQYDTRLQLDRPPYFPTWANSQWSLRYSGEISTPANVRG
jgi:type II secretory pathway pseudopilin PulG